MTNLKTLVIALLLCFIQIYSQTPNETGICGFDITRCISTNQLGSRTALNSFSASAIYTCGNVKVYYEDVQLHNGGGFDDPLLGAVRRNTFCAVLNYIQSVFNFTCTIDFYVNSSFCNNASPPNPPPSNMVTVLAFANPIFPSTFGTIPGFFGGYLYDHITSGNDPDPNNYDAELTVNFDLQNSSGHPCWGWYDDYNVTTPCCKFDLFSTLLHEVGHAMGFISNLGEGPTPTNYLVNKSNSSNIGCFTKFDEHFLWYGDVRNPGSFFGNKLVVTAGSIPQINSSFLTMLSPLTNSSTPNNFNSVWMTNQGAPNNYKAFDGYWKNCGPLNPWGTAVVGSDSYLSHLDNPVYDIYKAGQHSPGYQPRYVMSPVSLINDKVREFSLQELRMFCQLGYALNPTFASTTSLSGGAVSNSLLLLNNSSPIRSNYNTNTLVKYPVQWTTDYFNALNEPENIPADFTITNPVGPGGTSIPLLTINLSAISTLSISDLDGDPISIYPNSVFGIRGVSLNGNNHGALSISNNSIITYSPPPGFFGRAQFGFNLWDGKEMGGYKIITIDVLNGIGSQPQGVELVVNGNFEDATEVRTASNPTINMSSAFDTRRMSVLTYGTHQSGGHPYLGNTANYNASNGLIRNGSYRNASGSCYLQSSAMASLTPFHGFGGTENASDPFLISDKPIPVLTSTNINECYDFVGGVSWGNNPTGTTLGGKIQINQLINPLSNCKHYKLEFDAAHTPPIGTYSNYGFPQGFPMKYNLTTVNSLTNTNSGAITLTSLSSLPFQYTVNHGPPDVNGFSWQHISEDFVYCGVPSNTFVIHTPLQTNSNLADYRFYIDNISLKEQSTPPPPLNVISLNSNTLFCPGAPTILTASVLNSFCNVTYTWQPGNIASQTIQVTPPSINTSYTVFASDGCRTGSAVVYPTPQPVGSFTAPPVCIGRTSSWHFDGLSNNLPPRPGYYTGPNISQSTTAQSSINVFVDLTSGTQTAGVYNYTYTAILPSGCMITYTCDIQYLGNPTITINPPCVYPGQTATITALPANYNYTWAPGGSGTNQIVVTPTGTTDYVIDFDNGGCTGRIKKVLSLLVPVTFTNLPTNPWCTFQSINYLENYLTSNVPRTGTWTASGGMSIVTSTLGNSAIISSSLASGVYTLTYAYIPLTNTTCVSSNQFTVSIIPGFTLSASGPTVMCYNLSQSVVLNATANTTGLTYTWMPGTVYNSSVTVSPSVSTLYTIQATNGLCRSSMNYLLNVNNNCCSGSSYVSATTLSNATLTGVYTITNNINITGSVKLSGEFVVSPNVSITISPGATLTSGTKPELHFRGCTAMWSGINVLNGGKLLLHKGDLIEDAITGVASSNCTSTSASGGFDIDLYGVTFNKNYISVAIRNYTQNVINQSPFNISYCIFTCRDFNISPGSYSWPSTIGTLGSPTTPTNPLASPYLLSSLTPTVLKSPYSGTQCYGVVMENSGLTANVASVTPTYYNVYIGDQSSNYNSSSSINIFDNLFVSVLSSNSNVGIYNNIFQNSRSLVSSGTPGMAVYAVNSNNSNTSLNMASPAGANYKNIFYDCQFYVYASNLYELIVQNCEFNSTQSILSVPNVTNTGRVGVVDIGNRFKNHLIASNNFYNLNTGISVISNNGPLNVPNANSYGQFWDKYQILSNYFGPTKATITAFGNNYLGDGIVFDNLLNGGVNYNALGLGLNIAGNNLDRVFRGITIRNYSNGMFAKWSQGNSIKLIQQNPSNSQWGFRYENDIYGNITNNNVLGFSSNSTNSLVGIYNTMGTNASVVCNTVSLLAKSFEYAGLNSNTYWRTNVIYNSGRGYQISNNGIIGAQGATLAPQDNYWGVNQFTSNPATYVNSNSTPTLSPLFCRNNLQQFPQNNQSASGNNYSGINSLFSASSNTVSPCVPAIRIIGPGPSGPKYPIYQRAINDSLGYLGNYINETNEINKILIYKDFVQDPILLNSDSLYLAFYANMQSTNIRTICDIENNFSIGNINYANTLLSTFIPSSDVQQNYKTYFQVYSKMIDTTQKLSPSDLTQISILAHKCPFIDGPSVYNARSLYNLIFNTIEIYNDDECDEQFDMLTSNQNLGRGVASNQSIEEKKLSILESNNYEIFPNPATTKLFIVGPGTDNNINLSIFDVNSKLIVSKSVKLNNGLCQIDVDLINGIYSVRITSQNSIPVIKKLIIEKD